MPLKRPSPLDGPAGSSSEEEDNTTGEEKDASNEATSSEEEEEEERKEDYKLIKCSPLPSSASAYDKMKVASKKQDAPMFLLTQESSSESGSDSESVAEAAKTVQKRRKVQENVVMTVKSSMKKQSNSREGNKGSEALLDDGAKKRGEESKNLFQRVWREDDEVVLLEGISHFTAKKGFKPPADMKDFHDFVKKCLHVDVSRPQLQDKIRRLKKKFENNVRRGNPTFSKPHERKLFKLAKKVWGDLNETPIIRRVSPRKSQRASSSKALKEELVGMPENVKENEKMHADRTPAPSECRNELLEVSKNWGMVGQPKNVVKRGLERIEGRKKTGLEEEWRKLGIEELELFVRRTELVMDRARLILEAYKCSRGR